jgi:hypothetical protein
MGGRVSPLLLLLGEGTLTGWGCEEHQECASKKIQISPRKEEGSARSHDEPASRRDDVRSDGQGSLSQPPPSLPPSPSMPSSVPRLPPSTFSRVKPRPSSRWVPPPQRGKGRRHRCRLTHGTRSLCPPRSCLARSVAKEKKKHEASGDHLTLSAQPRLGARAPPLPRAERIFSRHSPPRTEGARGTVGRRDRGHASAEGPRVRSLIRARAHVRPAGVGGQWSRSTETPARPLREEGDGGQPARATTDGGWQR